MPTDTAPLSRTAVDLALDQVARVAPLVFPLRQSVAVNPFNGWRSIPMTEAADQLQKAWGARLLMPASFYAAAWKAGQITRTDLTEAETILRTNHGHDALIAALYQPEAAAQLTPLLAEFVDNQGGGTRWAALQIEWMSSFLAAYLDRDQATWAHPWLALPLFEAWLNQAGIDRGPALAGLRTLKSVVSEVPSDARQAVAYWVARLKPKAIRTDDFLLARLRGLVGWTGLLQHQDREKALRSLPQSDLVCHLLACLLTLDGALYRQNVAGTPLADAWSHQISPSRASTPLWVWQRAYELGRQHAFAKIVSEAPPRSAGKPPLAQIAFCIDVRSEPLRRHLEQSGAGIRTLGVAGFFGVAVEATCPETGRRLSRGPALFAPTLTSQEGSEVGAPERPSWEEDRAWAAFQHASVSCFTYVECFGLGAVADLLRPKKSKPQCSRPAPSLVSASTASKVQLAAGLLQTLQLTEGFAQWVVLCGHGSTVANNPQSSALQCGACGGNAGDHNARLAAGLLNDPTVRAGLASEHGIQIPPTTRFVGAVHETTTDEITAFHEEDLGGAERASWSNLADAFSQASAKARSERRQSLVQQEPARLEPLDIAETRPEAALANNWAVVFAPRTLTLGVNLGASTFLHDYDGSRDPSGSLLGALLSAPGLVTAWINLQYYASQVDPDLFGAGDKVLHNVCAGLAVLEGRTGDIRPGLSLQSLRWGERLLHEPRRLSLFAAATRRQLDAALLAAGAVRELADHGWIHLFAVEAGVVWLRSETGQWKPF